MSGERWHGTAGGYSNHACRCDRCRRAWADYQLAYRAANPEQRRKNVERSRVWAAANLDRKRAQSREAMRRLRARRRAEAIQAGDPTP